MTFTLPQLPYKMDALAPFISQETLEYHYGKHHNTYVVNLNKLIASTEYEKLSLKEIVERADGGIFNNAAQNWNHSFYWECLSPNGGGEPKTNLADAIINNFGSVTQFKEEFTHMATTLFGSGWAWLVQDQDGKLKLTQTSNAGNPLTEGLQPLLTCDVWEHAYYIDYRNARPDYINGFWSLINWNFAAKNLR